MTLIRSLFFTVWLFFWTALLGTAYLPLLVFPRQIMARCLRVWAHVMLFGLRWINGIKIEIRGQEHIPTGAALIAGKHMGMLDTIVPFVVLPDVCFVMKRELTYIPLFGWHAMKATMIWMQRNSPQPMQVRLPRLSSALITSGTWLLLALGPAKAEIPGHRYVWGELPFNFITPERVVEGKTTCITDNYGNGGRRQNNRHNANGNWNNNWNGTARYNQTSSTYTTCTTIPPRVIPSSSSTKLLLVQYDCTDQTYDAKGDGKAWQSVREGYGDGVVGQFRRLCNPNRDPGEVQAF